MPFFLWGVWVTLKEKRAVGILLLSWLIAFIIPMTLAAEKLSRYSLMILPTVLLFISFGIETAIDRLLRLSARVGIIKRIAAGSIMVMFFLSLPGLAKDLKEYNKFFNGFDDETAQWIVAHMTPDTTIIATADRAVRYHVALKGKTLDAAHLWYWTGDWRQLDAFLAQVRGHCLVQADNWNRPHQLLIEPFTDKPIRYFETMGFHLGKTAGKIRYESPNGGNLIAPAIWVFERK